MKNNKLYLTHILESISRIEKYCAGGRESFMESTLHQDAVLRNLQTIGQSAGILSEDIKSNHQEIDWRAIVAFGNVLVHDYLGIDMENREQFLANEKTIEEIREETTADSVGYISVDGVVDAIGIPKEDLCLGCVTDKYPLDIPCEMHRFQKTLPDYEE